MRLIKFSLAFAIVATGLAGVALAQDSAEGNRLVFNPQIGANATQYTNVDDLLADTEGRVGWQVGLFVRYGKRFYFQPGVFYQQTSVDVTGPDDTEFEDIKDAHDVTSFWIPLEVGFDIISSDLVTLRANGGVAGTFVTAVGDNDLGLTKDDFESFRAGGLLGAGVDIAIVSVDLSYELGFTNVFTAPEGGESLDAKANTFRFSAGLVF